MDTPLGLLAFAAAIALALPLWAVSREPGKFSRVRTQVPGKTGYSVWSFEGGKWGLAEDRSAPGFVPGPPPAEPGQFEGHSLRVTSVPRPGAR